MNFLLVERGHISNRKNGNPIPQPAWNWFATEDMEEIEAAMRSVAGLDDEGDEPERWHKFKRNLRKVRNQFRAKRCQGKQKELIAALQQRVHALEHELAQTATDRDAAMADARYHKDRACRAERQLQTAEQPLPHAAHITALLSGHASC